ncbi:MAG: hypothetical protein AB7D37_05680 [Desulfovibrio sp.]
MWLSGVDRKPCEECRRTFKVTRWDTPEEREKKKHGPPCDTCRPKEHPFNADCFRIYKRCTNQLIVAGMGNAIDINLLAVEMVMRLERIPERDQLELMDQVQELARVVLGERAREAERKREKNGKGRR